MKNIKLSAILACGITISLPFVLSGCEAIDGMFDDGEYHGHSNSGGTYHGHSSSSSATVTTSGRTDHSQHSYSNGSSSVQSDGSALSSAAASASNAADDPSAVVSPVTVKPKTTTGPAVPLEAPAIGQ